MSRQVFVGNLPFTVGWGELKDLVREVAGVNAERADVMTNQMGKSRGFGTVMFATPEEAERAIGALNGYNFQGRVIEVREDRNAPAGGSAGASGAGASSGNRVVENVAIAGRSLYIGNLPYSVQWQDLKDLIRGAGNIVRADIPTDYQGRSKGYGIVTMSTTEDARKAVAMFAGYEFHGRRLDVREDRSAGEESGAGNGGMRGGGGSSSGPTGSGTQLYIGNLPYSFSWQDVKDLVRQAAGQVIRADVITDGVRSKGYATVVMANAMDAQKAIELLNGAEVQGRIIEVRYDRLAGGGAPPRVSGSQSAPAGGSGSAGGSATSPTVGGSAPSGSGTAVFLSNLPFTTRWQDLKDIFRPHNLVPTHADVMVDSAGRSKGMGTVRFGSREDAEQAVQIANGLSIGGRQIGARLDRFL